MSLPAPHIRFTREKPPCPRHGIRTRYHSKPADAGASLRPRDHRDWPASILREKTQMNFIPIKSTEAFHFPHPLFWSNIFNDSPLRSSRCLLNHLIRSISASLVSRTWIPSIPLTTNSLIYPEQPTSATTVLSHCLPSWMSYLIPLKHRAKHECTVQPGVQTHWPQYDSPIHIGNFPTQWIGLALQTGRDDLSPVHTGTFYRGKNSQSGLWKLET